MDIDKLPKSKLPMPWGEFSVIGFEDHNGEEHLAIYLGDVSENPLLRIHSQCLTGDALFSLRCDCGPQLAMALEKIASDGNGMVIYMAQEGRGIGLINKIRAYELQDQGLNTVEANEKLGFADDEREYAFCAEILTSMGISSVRLMTNNPSKIKGLEDTGIKVSERIEIKAKPTDENKEYLKVKSKYMGHMLEDSD